MECFLEIISTYRTGINLALLLFLSLFLFVYFILRYPLNFFSFFLISWLLPNLLSLVRFNFLTRVIKVIFLKYNFLIILEDRSFWDLRIIAACIPRINIWKHVFKITESSPLLSLWRNWGTQKCYLPEVTVLLSHRVGTRTRSSNFQSNCFSS